MPRQYIDPQPLYDRIAELEKENEGLKTVAALPVDVVSLQEKIVSLKAELAAAEEDNANLVEQMKAVVLAGTPAQQEVVLAADENAVPTGPQTPSGTDSPTSDEPASQQNS